MGGSYEYATGSVRAREVRLLREQDIDQLVNADSIERLSSLLKEKGYTDYGNDIDRSLEENMTETFEYIRSVAPDFSLFNCFLLRNDAHNIKLIIKGILRSRDYEGLIMEPFTVPTDDIVSAVSEKKYDLLPAWLSQSVEFSCKAVALGDAQLADAEIDRVIMEKMVSEAESTGVDFLARYIKVSVFYYNIKVLIRSAKMGKTPDFMQRAVCGLDGFKKDEYIKAASAGLNELIRELGSTDENRLSDAIEAYKNGGGAFEKYVDDLLMIETEVCKMAAYGEKVLIGYYLAKETENKIIHIIASGIRTGSSPEAIKERVRRTYG